MSLNYDDREYSVLIRTIVKPQVLIITATDIETLALHIKLKPYENEKIIKTYKDAQTYYIGMFGEYSIVHVQCSMGSQARDASLNTVRDAISHWEIKAVVMVGIAFGADEKEQNIGDVLISECVCPYNKRRIGKNGDLNRSIDAPSGRILLNRFKNTSTWEFFLDGDIKAKKIIAPILSGEELIDNPERRKQLLSETPKAKGGEMEGAGIYAAADGKIEWILIKGICDFADGNKQFDKTKRQQLAAQSAVSLCLEVFEAKSSLGELGILPVDAVNSKDNNCENKRVDVLFEVYDESKEKFYIVREADGNFTNQIQYYGLWLFGKSGNGKSTLIIRNLKIAGQKLHLISLSNFIGETVESILYHIYTEVAGALGEKIIARKKIDSAVVCTNLIAEICKKAKTDRNVVFVIDEIPVENSTSFKLFVKKVISLLISINNEASAKKIQFVFSSINSPKSLIPEGFAKIHEYIKFIEIPIWDKPALSALVEKIEKELFLQNLIPDMDLVYREAKGSPRFIKILYRNILSSGFLKDSSEKKITLADLIRETKEIL